MTKNYKTLIIDDEELARHRLKRLLANYPENFQIIGEAKDGNDAFEQIEELKPDLIFLDIQMPGKNVFELLEDITHEPLVVFCTAYDNYALKAFETNSVDYLLKPVEKERIETTISKLDRLHKNQSMSDIINVLSEFRKKEFPRAIPYKSGDKITLVKLSNITYFQAESKYVNFYDTRNKEYITEQTLQVLSDKLPPQFIRISRSVIVNTDYVKSLRKYFRGKFIFILNDLQSTKIQSGGSFRSAITKKFNI